ncbi:calcium-activated chloride channel regulator 1-like [Rhinophrynus dorsalis]
MIKLVNGGYEDIVIAINPEVKEDVKIIENIKEMVKEATSYLFHATKKRLFIRSVKILIPMGWTENNYLKPRTERYDTADVIIANSYLKYGDDPYTLQYGACGEPGRYIHFTPNFLLDNKLISVYGPRGRVFVHEWAHLRWGVFDEYNNEKPYYISGKLKVEATRCSLNITGTYRIPTNPCQGSSCPTRPCNSNPKTGLYEEGCVFIPEKKQFPMESIMYSQALSSVSEFCDASNHNTEAPTLQNRMCNSRSTWEVIMNSTDINSTAPKADSNIPVPSFSLLQFRDRVLTLVLDVSGSMSTNKRIDRLYQAAEVFLIQIIEYGSHVGIVSFASSASVVSPLKQIYSDEVRNMLKNLIPTTANGGTNICAGVQEGIKVNTDFDGTSNGTEIVLLTDGEDNLDTKQCFPDILKSGIIIHSIALGPNADMEVNEMAKMTDPSELHEDFLVAFTRLSILSILKLPDSSVISPSSEEEAPDSNLRKLSLSSSCAPESPLSGSELLESPVAAFPVCVPAVERTASTSGFWFLDAAGHKLTYKQALAAGWDQGKQGKTLKQIARIPGGRRRLYNWLLESSATTLTSKECFNGTVFIDGTVGNETFFLVTWQYSLPIINLQDPKGRIYNNSQFTSDTTSKSTRLKIPGTAERGPWVYSLCNNYASNQAIGIVVNSKAANKNLPPITVNAHMNKDTNSNGDPMVVYASVSQGLQAVLRANVTAIIESENGVSKTFELLDNGAGADIIKNDGIYSRYFTSFSVNGRYSLKVRAEGKDSKIRLKRPRNNALYVPGYIENGEIIMNPLRPEINDDDLVLNFGDFIRTASGASFVVSNVPSGVQADIYKPEKITDLEANIQDNMIVLQWTATGDDLDHGTASRYDLRMSTNPKELKDNFGQSTSVDISIITPQPAGASEIFKFTPDNIVIENGTILYFAMVAIDKVNQTSDQSNIAQAALFIPPTVLPPTPKPDTNDNIGGLSITHLALIICGSIIILCLIISITVCIVNCQKKGKKSDAKPQNNWGRDFNNPGYS